MAIHFNADEIFEIAERIEDNGARFYKKAAEMFKGSGADELLKDLAKMEVEHKATFAKMRAEMSAVNDDSVTFDPDNETKRYLRAIADGHVFDYKPDPTKLLTGKEDLSSILKMAIIFEKDSIVFYAGIRSMVPANLGRDQIERIIKEEESHIVLLSGAYEKFKAVKEE